MGKSNKKGGLSGISRFVVASMKSSSTAADATTSKPTPTANLDLESKRGLIERTAEAPPTKRRKGNDGSTMLDDTSTQTERRWIEKYDATGLAEHYTEANQVPEHLQKYFSQRYRFFSLYSTPPGCLLDEEGWYSVTPELIADQIAERCRCDTILDAFCGVGGNAIAFAKTCQRVIALDTSPTRLALARHNAQIYGVADRIEFILADYLSFAKSYLSLPSTTSSEGRKIDIVFLSPPWGGPSYLSGSSEGSPTAPASPTTDQHPSYSLSSIQPIHGAELFDRTRKITRNVAYYLPRNTRLDEIGQLLSKEAERTSGRAASAAPVEEQVEVEEEWMGNKLKALTCYFGGLVAGQEDMF